MATVRAPQARLERDEELVRELTKRLVRGRGIAKLAQDAMPGELRMASMRANEELSTKRIRSKGRHGDSLVGRYLKGKYDKRTAQTHNVYWTAQLQDQRRVALVKGITEPEATRDTLLRMLLKNDPAIVEVAQDALERIVVSINPAVAIELISYYGMHFPDPVQDRAIRSMKLSEFANAISKEDLDAKVVEDARDYAVRTLQLIGNKRK